MKMLSLLFMVRSFLQVAGRNSQFDTARKIVVITTRLLSDAHRYILRCLSTHQNVCRCTIYTSISEVHVINLYTNNFRNLTFFAGMHDIITSALHLSKRNHPYDMGLV